MKVPVLLTHHFRESTGDVVSHGVLSDLPAKRVLELFTEARVSADYRSFDRMGHSTRGQAPRSSPPPSSTGSPNPPPETTLSL